MRGRKEVETRMICTARHPSPLFSIQRHCMLLYFAQQTVRDEGRKDGKKICKINSSKFPADKIMKNKKKNLTEQQKHKHNHKNMNMKCSM